MAATESGRRLIVNADDFGRSDGANAAIIRAHREGILTSASLMVTGDAWKAAVELARENPRLGVGLHLTLVGGRVAAQPHEVPGLVGPDGEFVGGPVSAGMRYFFLRRLRHELAWEIQAQLDRFHSTGLVMDHVNGHLNIHLHPTVFSILLNAADTWGIRAVRLTRDLLGLNWRMASGHWLYRLSHAGIFGALAGRAEVELRQRGIRFTPRVFGLLQNGRVTEDYLLKLLSHLPDGDSELYSHPSLDQAPAEFEALVSAPVRALTQSRGIKLIRYQDL